MLVCEPNTPVSGLLQLLMFAAAFYFLWLRNLQDMTPPWQSQ